MTIKLFRLVLIGAGLAALGHAASGIIDSRDTRLAYFRFLTFALTGHELVLMPIVLLTAVLIGWFVTARARPVIQAAIIASAALTVIALPGVLGYGRSADLPSALPRHYGYGLLIILLIIWSAAGLAIIARGRKVGDRDQT
jgi:hypothetical protein